mmetsp:Transcript_7857/g.7790  ORF Transcript_7857/g.7790 Transcript_7857/m.7790 type:complete len:279 (-) Transcript_7857:75-911(-)
MKLAFPSIVFFLQLIAISWAYSISKGSIRSNGESVSFGEINTQEVKQLSINSPKDRIDISLNLKDDFSKAPNQIVVTLGNNKGLDSSYVPKFDVSSKLISLSIPVKKIAERLKIEDKLFLNLIVGDSRSKANLFKSLVEILPSEDLKASSTYVEVERNGIKPEIHHQFREDPKTVNPVIPIIFIGVATTLFFGLIITWCSIIGTDLFGTFNQVSGCKLVYNFGFLISLIGFEFTFIRYYLGATIFVTLFYAFVLGGPSIYFGSRVFRDLAKYHRAGRA